MSMRRFAAYFLALAATSTVAFASTLMGQPAPAETTASDPLSMPASDSAARLFRAMMNQAHHKSVPRIAQVALVKWTTR